MSSARKLTNFFAVVMMTLIFTACSTTEKTKDAFSPDLSHWNKIENAQLDSYRYDLGFISRGCDYICSMEGEKNFSVPYTIVKGMQIGEKSDFVYNQDESPCFCLDLYYGDEECVIFYFFDDFKYVGYIDNNSEYNNPQDIQKYELLNGEDMKLLFQNYRFYFTYDELDKVDEVVEDFMQKYPDLLSAILEVDIGVKKSGDNYALGEERFEPLDYSIFWKDYNFEYAMLDVNLLNKLSNERFFTEKLSVQTKNIDYNYVFRVQEMADGSCQLVYIMVDKL